MTKRIGNLDIDIAALEAKKMGFSRYLGGRYSWQGIRESGQEKSGSPPETYSAGKYGPDDEHLPDGWWYDSEQDILLCSYSESYLQGQSSTAFFSS